MSEMNGVKALFFDVFGTVVNWRATVSETLQAEAKAKLVSPEESLASAVRLRIPDQGDAWWAEITQSWRNKYFAFTRTYSPDPNGGKFIDMDTFFLSSLKELVQEYNLQGLWNDEDLERISKVWHRLEAWPDSAQGLERLKQLNFDLVTLSNGNKALLKDLANHARLPFTDIFGADDFGVYKPNKQVYLGAAKKLGLETSQCALVAAHLGDLQQANSHGMKTIYIERPEEEAWDKAKSSEARTWVDLWIPLNNDVNEESLNAAQVAQGGLVEAAKRLEANKQSEAARQPEAATHSQAQPTS